MAPHPVVLAGLGGAVLLYMASKTDKGAKVAADAVGAVAGFLSRGIRNNNPGNIRHNKNNDWLGMASAQTDSAFVQFSEPRYGVRALARVLTSYERSGLRTVAGLIGRWAPASENNTSAYVGAVASELHVAPDQALDVRSYLPRLTAAIIKHENGVQPYSATDLQNWVYS